MAESHRLVLLPEAGLSVGLECEVVAIRSRLVALIPCLLKTRRIHAVLACPGAEVSTAEIPAIPGLLRDPPGLVGVGPPVPIRPERSLSEPCTADAIVARVALILDLLH